jgi:hypothetical protein
MNTCTIRYRKPLLPSDYAWNAPVWEKADSLAINRFRQESSNHHPDTQAKLVYTHNGLAGIFQVNDRYVRCIHTTYMDPVYTDSCVELFIKPASAAGYFNFEFNCGGTLRAGYIIDPARTPDGFREWTPLPPEHGAMVTVFPSLPRIVEPELTTPVTWTLGFSIPFALFEQYVGPLGDSAGQVWHGNLYKCADQCSHPHWASWAPLAERNFHAPDSFGTMVFEP